MTNFGVVAWKTRDPQKYDYEAVRGLALEAESLGFSSFWLSDHFHGDPRGAPQLECFATLAAIAAETKTIRVGPLVACISYRLPTALAKIGATIDVISGGRFELALGAGWDVDEYKAYGIPFPSASERVGQLEEGIQIIKRVWTEPEVTFNGRYFSVNRASNEPKPVQAPRPPIWIGSKGKRMLGLVARYADGWNIDTAFTKEIYEGKLAVLEDECRKAHRKIDDISKSVALEFILGKNQDVVDATVEQVSASLGMSRGDYLRERVAGTPDTILPRVQEYVDAGIDLMICSFINRRALNSLELFIDDVIPRVSHDS